MHVEVKRHQTETSFPSLWRWEKVTSLASSLCTDELDYTNQVSMATVAKSTNVTPGFQICAVFFLVYE